MNTVTIGAEAEADVDSSRQGSTREALLNAAERLLAKHGVAATSTRDIIGAAGANLGAINYHFGSKERLVLEVFARRLRPLNEVRIARLEALEKSAGGRGPKLEQIVEVLVRSAVEAHEAKPGETALLQLICRGFQEPNPEVKAFIEKEFAGVAKRLNAAILKSAPDLPRGELFWRMRFFFGALHQGLDAWSRFEAMPCPDPDVQPERLDREAFIRLMVAFVAGGLAASTPVKWS